MGCSHGTMSRLGHAHFCHNGHNLKAKRWDKEWGKGRSENVITLSLILDCFGSLVYHPASEIPLRPVDVGLHKPQKFGGSKPHMKTEKEKQRQSLRPSHFSS